MDTSYLEKNRQLWNARVKSHLDSGFYDLQSFREGKSSLNTPELRLLGNVRGKSILHLQCHFGQDSLSLARMGATVTGVDLSDEAVTSAQKLATELNLPARFICCDVYDTRKVLNEQFDLVFSSYGTIGWLPDLKPWAAVVASSLKPGGRLYLLSFIRSSGCWIMILNSFNIPTSNRIPSSKLNRVLTQTNQQISRWKV